MPDYNINGILVNFPYEPYEVQTAYMEKVIECLKRGENGMLESPTGTGKTLSLLCASLSWLSVKKADLQAKAHGLYQLPDGDFVTGLQNSLREATGSSKPNTAWNLGIPKIIYASRTHSQLSQAVQELKKTGYKHVKVAVLGSRDQMCIHHEVSKEENNIAKMHLCQVAVKNRACHFYNNFEKKKNELTLQETGILDIEDLVKFGRKQRVCPYYMSRELKNEADMVFMPYNYILDQKHIKSHGVELENNVIILDEAHNVEKMCEESVSIKIRSTDVALCIEEITQVMKNLYENGEKTVEFSQNTDNTTPDFHPEELCVLKTMFLELEKAIDDIQIQSGGSTFSGGYIIELLAKAQITYEKSFMLIDLLVRIIQFLSVTGNSPFQFKGAAIQKMVDLLKIVFRMSGNGNICEKEIIVEQLKRCFKVHAIEEEPKNAKQKSNSWGENRSAVDKAKGKVISFMCFSPSYGMKLLMENRVWCVILTSGTLSPLPPLISELGIPIPWTLQNPHVIGPGQVSVSVVTTGPDGYKLNSSYSTRNDPRYITSLGMTVLNVCRVIPHGVLIFFPSYPIMNKCQEDWQQSGLWSKIASLKPLFVEPRSRDSFNSTITEYYNKVQDPVTRGACFMAVTRGKVSEGLDFMDVNGRAVIITGLPYPPMMDTYVKLKRSYLQENQGKNSSQCLSSDQWYMFEASRAVNQAIGRVIRHKNDYGAILLCDARFEGYSFKKALSSWVQPHIKQYNAIGPLIRDLRQFFINAEKMLPPPRLKGPDCELKPLAPVAASFEMVPSRTSAVNKTGNMAPVLNGASATSEWSPDEYLSKPGNSETSAKNERTDLFGALEKPTNVIDFNNMKPESSKKSLFKWTDNEEPNIKKKKFKLAPPKIVSLTQESVDLFAENVITKPGTSKQAVSQPGLSKPSSSQANSFKSSQIPTTSKAPPEVKVSEIAAYLKEVKKSLDADAYRQFSLLTHGYDKNKDFQKLLDPLWEVMMGKGRNFSHLFKGYRRFLQASHRKEFDAYCARKIPD